MGSPTRKRSAQRGTAASTRAEREHQVDAIVERGKRLKRIADELDRTKKAPKKVRKAPSPRKRKPL